MKLHSPAFERSLRRRVKAAVRSSPALKREYRIARKFRRHYTGYFIFRMFSWVMIGVITGSIQKHSGSTIAALGVLSLWAFISVFLHAQGLFTRLFLARDLPVLFSLPLSKDIIFRWELQKFARASLFSLMEIVVSLGTLACILGFSALQWIPLLFISLLAWLVSVALGVFCAARLKPRRYTWVSYLIFPSIIGAFFIAQIPHKGILLDFINRVAPSFNLVLPTGWAISLFQLLLPHPQWPITVMIVPLTAIIATMPNSLRRLRSFYADREFVRPEAHDLSPETLAVPARPIPVSGAAPSNLTDPEEARRRGPTEIVEIIQSRVTFAPPVWPKSAWLESILWRWLTPRERVLFEFAFPRGLSLMKPWGIIAAVMIFGAGISYIGLNIPVVFAGIFFPAAMAIGAVNQSGSVFRAFPNGGVKIPLLAYYPVGISELMGLLLKLSVVQFPLLAACGCVSGLLIAHLAGAPLLFGFLAGLRGAFLCLACRFVFAVFGLSSGTNDTQRFRLRNLCLMAAIAPFATLFIALSVAGLFVPQPYLAWGFTALAVLSAYLFFRVYVWFYNRSFFDLMNLPRR